VSGEGELVRYGRIEVDLGAMTEDEAGSDLLATRMGEGLAAALGRSHAAFGVEAAKAGAGDAGVWGPLSLAAMLEGFLVAGTLPWPEPGGALAALTTAVGALDEDEIAALAGRLRPRLADDRAAERLVRQFPLSLVRRIVAAFPREAGAQACPGLQAAQPQAILSEAAAAAIAAEVAAAARGAPPRIRMNPPALPADAAPRLLGSGGGSLAQSASGQGGAAPSTPYGGTGTGTGTGAVADGRPVEEPEIASWPAVAAGQVLLHPFLPTLFRRAGLTDADGLLIGPPERRRAALLAHFVATGADEVAEPDLLVAKLLCGVDFAEPAERRLDPSALERELAEGLLAAVVSHWEALRGTSAAGLREAFLERPGRLERTAEGWKLLVETRTLDVLLDRLPWTISVVKTPFMAGMLRVLWR
jgi:hypothetical protein